MGSYRAYSIHGRTAVLVPEFAVEDLPLAELQPRFLRLQWRICPRAEHSDDDENKLYSDWLKFWKSKNNKNFQYIKKVNFAVEPLKNLLDEHAINPWGSYVIDI